MTETQHYTYTSPYNINNYYDILHTKLHNFLYTHLCRIPYAVNILVSRSWWWAKYCPKYVEL